MRCESRESMRDHKLIKYSNEVVAHSVTRHNDSRISILRYYKKAIERARVVMLRKTDYGTPTQLKRQNIAGP